MSLTMTPMTELDAVNVMLASIGQTPVNTLNVSGIRDVEIARTTLHNTLRAVSTRGWHFNTDRKFPVAADINGKVAVPADALKMDAHREWDADLVIRDDSGTRRMWDLVNHTFVLTENHEAPFYFDIVRVLSFETIPQTARNYIGYRAARQFQAYSIGSDLLYRFTKEDELEALAELERGELEQTDVNFLADGNPQNQIWARRIVTR